MFAFPAVPTQFEAAVSNITPPVAVTHGLPDFTTHAPPAVVVELPGETNVLEGVDGQDANQSVIAEPSNMTRAPLEALANSFGQATTFGTIDLSTNLTTSGSTAPLFAVGSFDLVPATTQSGPLVDIDTFRADPRFAGVDGSGYAVVILDTGIDVNHPFFGPDANMDGISDRIVYQEDFADGDMDASDNNNHGSNVSSIAAGGGNASGNHIGMAPGADIIHLKVFRDTGEGNFGFLELALQWVVANAATYNIVSVNMSLSDSGNYQSATNPYGIGDEIATLKSMDVITVSASGNDFDGNLGVAYPAADPNSLSVGAVYDADVGGVSYGGGTTAFSSGPDRITPFSQRDDELSDIFAPGAAITGANRNGGTVTMHGTSQAAPHIAGIAALSQQLAVDTIGRRLSQDEFINLVQSTAVTIFDGDDEDDNVTNSGLYFPRVDVLALGEEILALAAAPTITVADVSVSEGDAGVSDLVFTVNLSEAAAQDVSVQYATSDVSATSGVDYAAVSDTLVILAGQTSGTINVSIFGDTDVELDETFTLTLSNPVGAELAGTELVASGGINDDDADSTSLLFQESFEGAAQYTLVGGGDVPGDYWKVLVPDAPELTFVAGNADGAFVFGGRDLNGNFGGESGAGATRTVQFDEVDLTNATAVTVTLALATAPLNPVGNRRFEAPDYVQISASTDGGATFSVLDLFSGPATGSGLLSNGVNALGSDLSDFSFQIADSASSVIVEVQAFNDGSGEVVVFDNLRVDGISGPPPATQLALNTNDTVKPEGDAGTTTYAFEVVRMGDVSGATSVNYQVTAGVVDGSDFVGGLLPSGIVNFIANETSQTINIEVNGDVEVEPDEDFTVQLFGASAGTAIIDADETGTIVNDDVSSTTLLFQESFEGAAQYTLVGGGDVPGDYWKVLVPDAPELTFVAGNADGAFVFGGRDLNGNFGGESGAGATRTVQFDEVDLTNATAVTVTLALATAPLNPVGNRRFEAPDYVQISASTDGGATFSVLDLFSGPATGSGLLSNGVNALGSDLSDFSFQIADSASSVIVEVQAFNDNLGEVVVFDNLRIEAEVAAPSNATVQQPRADVASEEHATDLDRLSGATSVDYDSLVLLANNESLSDGSQDEYLPAEDYSPLTPALEIAPPQFRRSVLVLKLLQPANPSFV